MGLFKRLFGRSQARNIKPEVITPPAPPASRFPARSEMVTTKDREASKRKQQRRSHDWDSSYGSSYPSQDSPLASVFQPDYSSFDTGSSSSSSDYSGGGGDFGGGGSSGDY